MICGPTATGKTSLGVTLAKLFNGEIVSADSRQVYTGLDIVTGKDISPDSKFVDKTRDLCIETRHLQVGYRLKDNVPIWLVDIVEPEYIFNVGEYRQIADIVINNIIERNHLPIIVGGTGLYIRAITSYMNLIYIPPNKALRKELEKMDRDTLGKKLQELDPGKWSNMNNSDRLNPRRLIRAIELSLIFKNRNIPSQKTDKRTDDNVLMIGLTVPTKPDLYGLIDKRIHERIDCGAASETELILKKKYDVNLPAFSASGYRPLLQYIEHTLSFDAAIKKWKGAEHEYARHQLTWFKRDSRVIWFDVTGQNYQNEIDQIVRKWYTCP